MHKAQPSVLTFIMNKLALFAPFTLLLWGLQHHPHLWRLRVRTACRVPFTHSFVQPSIRRFCKVFEKNFVSFLVDLLDHSKVFHSSPRPFYAPFFSILLLMVSFWWICRYGGYNGKLAYHISLSQRPDPKEKQVINLDQDVQVCGYFWWMVYELLLYAPSLLFLSFWIRGYLFFLLFDMPEHVAYLFWVCIFYSFFLTC